MNYKSAILLIALFCVLTLGLTACLSNTPSESTIATTADTAPSISPEQIYDDACAKLSSAANLIVSYHLQETRTIREDTYSKEITGIDSYCNIGTDKMDSVIDQTLKYGPYQVAYTELYSNGTACATVNGSSFSCFMDSKAFLSRQIPHQLLDKNLYTNITIHPEEETFLLTFTDATAPEHWAISAQNIQLRSATGSALIDSSGNIMRYSYQLSYTCNEVVYELVFDTTLTASDHLDLSATRPDYPQSATPLSNLDVPKFLLQAVGDLFTSNSISAEIEQTLSSKVYSLTRTQQSQLHLHGSGDDLRALMKTQQTLTDYRADCVASTQIDYYDNGTFTHIWNDDAPVKREATPEDIRIKWENTILNAFVALTYLSDANLTDNGSVRTLEFRGNDAFCDAVTASFQSVLPNDLDAIADSFETVTAGGYLRVDRNTGLPVEMGMNFERHHGIFGATYPLSYALNQSLTLSSEIAQEVIDTAF